MKLKDMFAQYFNKHAKDSRQAVGQVPRQAAPETDNSSDPQAPVPFTGTPPGSDIQVVPEMLEKVTPGTKGVA